MVYCSHAYITESQTRLSCLFKARLRRKPFRYPFFTDFFRFYGTYVFMVPIPMVFLVPMYGTYILYGTYIVDIDI